MIPPDIGDSVCCLQEDQLQHARVEMGEVREENERLRSLLPEIVQDYQSLQKHVIDVLRREETCRKPVTPIPPVKANWENDREPEELVVSLTLGRSLSGKTRTEDARNIDLNDAEREDEMSKEELRLRLGCTYPEQGSGEPAKKQPSHESIKELKEDEIAEIWPPSKILKTMKSADDEPSQPTQVKRARVSVRVRCDAPTVSTVWSSLQHASSSGSFNHWVNHVAYCFDTDKRRMSMEKIRTEDCERESVPTGILPMYSLAVLSRKKTGNSFLRISSSSNARTDI